MSGRHWLLLSLTVAGISAGQILFKYAANALPKGGGLGALLFSPPLAAGVLIYGVSTVLWVYVLQEVALSKAYPFFALSFVVVPLLSALLFGESVGRLYVLGALLISLGVVLVTR